MRWMDVWDNQSGHNIWTSKGPQVRGLCFRLRAVTAPGPVHGSAPAHPGPPVSLEERRPAWPVTEGDWHQGADIYRAHVVRRSSPCQRAPHIKWLLDVWCSVNANMPPAHRVGLCLLRSATCPAATSTWSRPAARRWTRRPLLRHVSLPGPGLARLAEVQPRKLALLKAQGGMCGPSTWIHGAGQPGLRWALCELPRGPSPPGRAMTIRPGTPRVAVHSYDRELRPYGKRPLRLGAHGPAASSGAIGSTTSPSATSPGARTGCTTIQLNYFGDNAPPIPTLTPTAPGLQPVAKFLADPESAVFGTVIGASRRSFRGAFPRHCLDLCRTCRRFHM